MRETLTDKKPRYGYQKAESPRRKIPINAASIVSSPLRNQQAVHSKAKRFLLTEHQVSQPQPILQRPPNRSATENTNTYITHLELKAVPLIIQKIPVQEEIGEGATGDSFYDNLILKTLDSIQEMDQKYIKKRDSYDSSRLRLLSANISFRGDESPDDFLLPDLNKEVELQLGKLRIKNNPTVQLPQLATIHTQLQ